jgi:GAF domain-containing protein
LGKLVTASIDLDTTLSAIVDAARELTGADSSAILVQDDDDSLLIRVGRGVIGQSVGERVRVQSSLAGRALCEGQAVLVRDMLTEVGRARPDLDERSRTRSYLAAPLIWRGERLGVVTLGASDPAAFAEAEVQLVTELAEQAAAAVAHARAFVEERTRRQEAETIVRQLAERSTELERLQQRINQNEKLTAMGELVQGLAHEMNTPLGVVMSNLSVLGRHAEVLSAIAETAQQSLAPLMVDPLSASLAAPLHAAIREADLAYTLADLPELLNESAGAVKRVAELVRSMGNFRSVTLPATESWTAAP